jgi:hypothetical protein
MGVIFLLDMRVVVLAVRTRTAQFYLGFVCLEVVNKVRIEELRAVVEVKLA